MKLTMRPTVPHAEVAHANRGAIEGDIEGVAVRHLGAPGDGPEGLSPDSSPPLRIRTLGGPHLRWGIAAVPQRVS
jgi:hypothetical protein